MDQTSQLPHPGLRQLNLKKSFKLGIRSLLTSCSKEEFSKAFSMFNSADQAGLHRLFIQVITSLHGNIEEDFESICLETQVGFILDTMEQLVEEWNLNTLFANKTTVGDVKQELSRAKEEEIQYLSSMLETAMEKNRQIRARVESLKNEKPDFSAVAGAVEKLQNWNMNSGLF